MIRVVPLILLAILFISTFAGYMTVVTEGYPKNPLKWAQERRRRANESRLFRIRSLEHELGYIPCSFEDCGWCRAELKDREKSEKDYLGKNVAGISGNSPLLTNDMLDIEARDYNTNEPITTQSIITQAYSQALDMDVDMYYDYAKRSYIINTKRNGMAMSNVISEAALQEFERNNYELMQKIAGVEDKRRTSSGGPR